MTLRVLLEEQRLPGAVLLNAQRLQRLVTLRVLLVAQHFHRRGVSLIQGPHRSLQGLVTLGVQRLHRRHGRRLALSHRRLARLPLSLEQLVALEAQRLERLLRLGVTALRRPRCSLCFLDLAREGAVLLALGRQLPLLLAQAPLGLQVRRGRRLLPLTFDLESPLLLLSHPVLFPLALALSA